MLKDLNYGEEIEHPAVWNFELWLQQLGTLLFQKLQESKIG